MASTRVGDRYTLDHEVGRGACGAVWAGNDEVLRRPVAIKRVGPPPGSEDDEVIREVIRAEREARLAAQVNHPHVISVFDLVRDDDHYWLVMEYVEGEPLSTIIRERGPRPPDEVAALLAPVADALSVAHDLGIVHRDVKPSNILVRHDGQAKLSDFGIARGVQDATLTQAGAVTGSPAYLAPEVASGSPATPASDVWAFGATLYHALSGTPPYHLPDQDNAVLAVLYRIVHDDPPRLPSAGRLARVLEMTMQPDPAQRPTMAEVRDLLAGAPAAEAPSGATEPSPRAALTVPLPPSSTVPPALQPSTATVAYRPGPTPARVALVGAVALSMLVLLGVGMLLVNRGTDDPGEASAAPEPASASTEAASSAPSPTERETAARPTAAELQAFAEDYVQTASTDPDTGFDMLTPRYQARSTEYTEFWGPMSNPRILDIAADPEAMTVTYTYRYEFPGSGSRTEQVTLDLVERGGRLLIADAH